MKVSRVFAFDSSHVLPNYDGPCGRLHGHTYKLRVTIEGHVNAKTQMVMDYTKLKKIVQPWVDLLDHTHLNLYILYPTAENIAAWFGQKLLLEIDHNEYFLTVVVSETPKTQSTWKATDECPEGSQGTNTSEFLDLQERLKNLWVPSAEKL